MPRTNWQDGGGCYAPGSDTPDAPWNQPDLEVTEENIEEATKEVWFLLEWNPDNEDVHFYDVYQMIENVCPRDYYTYAFRDLLDEMEVLFESRRQSVALDHMPQHHRDRIKTHAQAWIENRAEERAQDPDIEF